MPLHFFITVYPFALVPVTYGKMFLDRKAAVGVWPAAEVKNEARLGEGK